LTAGIHQTAGCGPFAKTPSDGAVSPADHAFASQRSVSPYSTWRTNLVLEPIERRVHRARRDVALQPIMLDFL
jgi:hypothetical protein